MAVFPVRLSEDGRGVLGTLLAIFHGLCAVGGIALIFYGVYIRHQIEDSLVLLQDYNGGTLTNMLISVGVLVVVMNVFGAKVCFDCGRWETRERFQSVILMHFLFMFVLNWVVLAAAILCNRHQGLIQDSMHKGFFTAMTTYKDVHTTKVLLDQLQLQYQCCGSSGYRDWFTVGWINLEFLDPNDPEVQR